MRSVIRTLTLIVALFLSVVPLARCGGTSRGATTNPPTAPTPPSLGPIDPAFVGTWSGTLDGSFGPGTFTMNLNASGGFRNEGSGSYCAVNGDWGVSAGHFTASGPDCTGTIVTFSAAVSGNTLAGEWTASSGRAGSFVCTKVGVDVHSKR
jgi:hypothetical protein